MPWVAITTRYWGTVPHRFCHGQQRILPKPLDKKDKIDYPFSMTDLSHLIRSLTRAEITAYLFRLEQGHAIIYRRQDLERELTRRDELEDKRRDTVRYPELQLGFH